MCISGLWVAYFLHIMAQNLHPICAHKIGSIFLHTFAMKSAYISHEICFKSALNLQKIGFVPVQQLLEPLPGPHLEPWVRVVENAWGVISHLCYVTPSKCYVLQCSVIWVKVYT